ncbi:transposase [Mesorhizobium australicum]|uniref:transposase n=1 Tax=Mesorhizobium australicum TaxID=536018 RepID=UPI00111C393C
MWIRPNRLVDGRASPGRNFLRSQRRTGMAMLLSVWYDLSDVKLAEALDDRASFRRFCGFSAIGADARTHGLCSFSQGARDAWT